MIASNEKLLDILYEELLTEDRWIAFLKELAGAFDANLSVLPFTNSAKWTAA